MEQFLGLLGGIAILVGFNLVLNYGGRSLRALGRSAMGKGTLSDNMDVAFRGMGPFQVRFNEVPLGDDGGGPFAKEIQVKGTLPVKRVVRLGFVTSVFDKTSENLEPVTSGLSEFQEQKTYAYQHHIGVGKVEPGVGFVGWIRAGVVLPQILSTPYGGRRKCVAMLRLIDLDDPPDISSGFHDKTEKLLGSYSLEFDFLMEGVGYREAFELRDEARAICIKIGVYVAMADGILENREGAALQTWVKKILDASDAVKREALKDKLNAALKDAYLLAKSSQLSLSDLTRRLAEIGDVATKYELVELCYDVAILGSNGDTRLVDRIAKALSLDLTEIERIRDSKIVRHADADRPLDIEQLLGIESGWDRETIKRHLRNEFTKWNNRVTTLPEGEERATAQRMLDAISDARKAYG